MTSRIVFESWQMVFPAIGFMIFASVFCIVVARVWRMKTPTLDRLNRLPLTDNESPRNNSHVRTE